MLFKNYYWIFLVLALSACGGGDSAPSNSAPTASAVNITDDNVGDAVVGDSLTGSYSYADAESDAEGISTFRWLRDGTAISGATSLTYTLVGADSGLSITFEVTPVAATGTITGSAVTSNSITVVNNVSTYSIGGTVTGLTGSGGLVLQNNGVDDLTINADASFIFAIVIADGSAYSVTVVTQPDSPGQSCTVTNGSGTLAGADITNVAVNCIATAKSWKHPSLLSDNISPDGENVSTAGNQKRVVMDDNGNALIVWLQRDGSKWQIFKSEYRLGSWTHPASLADYISVDSTTNAGQPDAAMDNNGNAIVVWSEYDGNIFNIYKAEYRSGSWLYPLDLTDNLNLDTSIDTNYPTVSMDDNGNVLIAWHGRTVFTCGDSGTLSCEAYFLAEYRSSSWLLPTDLSDHISPGDHRASAPPSVAMDNNGDALVVYEQENGAYHTYMSEFRSPGPWTHPLDTEYLSQDTTSASTPQTVMANNGDALIVWAEIAWGADGISSSGQILKSEYRSGSWTHPVGVTDNISPDGEYAWSPQLAMNSSGDAIIVWVQSDGSNAQIFKSEYRNGSWTHPSAVTDNISHDGRDAEAPQVAMDDNGDAIIVWEQDAQTDNCLNFDCRRIFMSEYRSGAWSHPADATDFISLDGQDGFGAYAAMDNNGDALIVWTQSDGNGDCAFPTTCLQTYISEYR